MKSLGVEYPSSRTFDFTSYNFWQMVLFKNIELICHFKIRRCDTLLEVCSDNSYQVIIMNYIYIVSDTQKRYNESIVSLK